MVRMIHPALSYFMRVTGLSLVYFIQNKLITVSMFTGLSTTLMMIHHFYCLKTTLFFPVIIFLSDIRTAILIM